MNTDPPIAARVIVYRINFDNTTGAFLGYGTLTGPSGLVVLHPRTGRRLLADAPPTQLTLRLQIVDDNNQLDVADGTVLSSQPDQGTGVTLPPAVYPWVMPAAVPAVDCWKQPPAQIADALAAREDSEPTEPPFPVPEPWQMPGPPGIHGPWCHWFPNCPGCK